MRTVQHHIDTLAVRIGTHPFFTEMTSRPSLRDALAFAPVLAPWVLGFQDCIRINAKLARDGEIQNQLQQHVSEDSGHELWFLEDLARIFGEGVHSISWLYGREPLVTREATLAITAELFQIRDDRLRLVYVATLESTSHTFIERAHHIIQASGSGEAKQLKYFGRTHEEAEGGHEMFEDGEQVESLQLMSLPEDVRSEGIAMVDRIFAQFERMADAAHQASLATR